MDKNGTRETKIYGRLQSVVVNSGLVEIFWWRSEFNAGLSINYRLVKGN